MLSVVIPAYGEASQLRALLDDLSQQDAGDSIEEILVVDDGSPQPIEPQIADLVARWRGRLRVVRTANGGGPAARNQGVELATGDLLLFLDQDMRVPADFVRVHLAVQSLAGPCALSARYRFSLLERGGPFAEWYVKRCAEWEEPSASLTPIGDGVYHAHPVLLTSTNLSIPSGLLRAAGGFPVHRRYGTEDQALGLLLGRRGERVLWTDRVWAQHVERRARLEPFCERQRIGMAGTVELIRRFPEIFGPLEATRHHQLHGPVRLGREPLSRSARKLVKTALMLPAIRSLAFRAVASLERGAPPKACERAYDFLVAAYLQRGWREGLCVPPKRGAAV